MPTKTKPVPSDPPTLEDQLAALPGEIAEAEKRGDAETLSHLIAKESILRRRLDEAQRNGAAEHLSALLAQREEAGRKHQAAVAQRRDVVVEAKRQIAVATAEVTATQREVVKLDHEINAMTRGRDDEWWTSRGLLVPGAKSNKQPPKEIVPIDRRFLDDHGRYRPAVRVHLDTP